MPYTTFDNNSPTKMDDRIFVPDLLLVKLKSAVCNIESTQNSSKVNDTFSGLTN